MIRVTLPLKTISESNSRGHWAKKAARVASQRFVAATAVRPFVNRPHKDGAMALPIEPIAITLTRVAPRRLDDDNLRGCLKAVRDGVADALEMDDGNERISWRYGQERGRPGEYAVRIILEPTPRPAPAEPSRAASASPPETAPSARATAAPAPRKPDKGRPSRGDGSHTRNRGIPSA